MPNPQRSLQRRSAIVEWWKIIAMGLLLAGLIYMTFLYQPAGAGGLGGDPPITRIHVAVPEIDQALLSQAEDATHPQRLVLEPAPLAHLLEKSVDIVPSVADALGMPREPIPVSMLRASPQAYRGAYLWYAGELGYLSLGKSGHPVTGYEIFEGYLETADGETIMFRVSDVPDDLKVGEFVRVEGFFLKLRDSATQPKAEMAPLLVGPELFRDHRPWPAITELDPETFADIDDDVVDAGGEWLTEFGDAEDDLEASQDVPLWTLASYAIHAANSPESTFAHWRQVAPFVSKEQLTRYKKDDVPAGEPVRVLGSLVKAEWFAARPNPVGIEYWTQALVQVRDLGGKVVPIWIPKKLEGVTRNESLEVRAYYFKRFVYQPVSGEGQVFTPVFVAADLTRFEVGPEHPAATWVKIGFAALVGFVIVLFFGIARRDRKNRDEHEVAMIERRRKRRSRSQRGAEQHAGT